MSPSEKGDILARVENQPGHKRKMLAELGIKAPAMFPGPSVTI